MANVRIKDLTTTAATTASDDFFGVDGATNGTRKLNAYSPTFGGNLTVGGTGTSSFAGQVTSVGTTSVPYAFDVSGTGNDIGLRINNSGTGTSSWAIFASNNAGIKARSLVLRDLINPFTVATWDLANARHSLYYTTSATTSTNGAFVVGDGSTAATNVSIGGGNIVAGGNLTVSGTAFTLGGGSVNPGSLGTSIALTGTGSSGMTLQVGGTSKAQLWADSSVFNVYALSGQKLRLETQGAQDMEFYTTDALNMILRSNGNLLIGTSTDAGNKLQVNGYIRATSVAGTAPSSGTGVEIACDAAKVGNILNYDRTAGAYKQLNIQGDPLVLNYSAGNVLIGTLIDGGQKLQVNGTAAISGNTTLGSGNTYPIYAYSGYFQFATATSGNFGSVGPTRGHSGTTSDGISIQTYNGSAWSESALFTKTSLTFLTNGTTALTLDSSQRTILAGALRLANTYVATPQVSTGYVTIQDSTGTTYKVLVAT